MQLYVKQLFFTRASRCQNTCRRLVKVIVTIHVYTHVISVHTGLLKGLQGWNNPGCGPEISEKQSEVARVKSHEAQKYVFRRCQQKIVSLFGHFVSMIYLPTWLGVPFIVRDIIHNTFMKLFTGQSCSCLSKSDRNQSQGIKNIFPKLCLYWNRK